MNKYQQIADAMVALARCVPDVGTVSATADGYVSFDLKTEEQAHAVATSFGIELAYSNSRDGMHRWLRGSARNSYGGLIYVYGPHVDIPAGGKPLDETRVDEALATAAAASGGAS